MKNPISVGLIYRGPNKVLHGVGIGGKANEALITTRHSGNYALRGTCDGCGSRFAYGAVIRDGDGEALALCEMCAAVELPLITGFIHEFKRKIGGLSKRHRALGAAEAVLKAHPGLEDALKLDHDISRDLLTKLYKYGELSEKQVTLAFNLVKWEAEKGERKAMDEARKAEAAHWPAEMPNRMTVEGTVLAVKWNESGYGASLKMLVETSDGRRCWGSVPSTLTEDVKGERITFMGSFSRSPDDPTFAFFKRPAVVVGGKL